jgi:hypothetical protein
LREVLMTLRRELAAAEVGGHRATVTLAIEVIESGPGGALRFGVVTGTAGATPSRHSITIELEPSVADAGLQNHPSSSAPLAVKGRGESATAGADTAKDKGLVESLTGMFGAPGFDNAARASVFADILESLTPEQVTALVSSFELDATEVPREKPTDPAVAAARIRIARLLRLGPERYKGGLETMLAVLKRTPAPSLIQTVRATWKTQDAWIDTTTPGVSIQP